MYSAGSGIRLDRVGSSKEKSGKISQKVEAGHSLDMAVLVKEECPSVAFGRLDPEARLTRGQRRYTPATTSLGPTAPTGPRSAT